METVACSILSAPRFSCILNRHYSKCYFAKPRNNFHSIPPFFSPLPLSSNFPGKFSPLSRFSACCSPSGLDHQESSQELAVLLEVEGVLMDAYRLGNRQSFNAAFKKLGLDCANWTEPVYSDLVRRSAGDEEKMLLLYFNRIGWPTSLPTSEKEKFIKSVLQEKEKSLEEFVLSKNLPLRPGLENFIDDAYKEGIPVVILTAYSKSGNDIARSIMEKLGNDQSLKVTIVGSKEVEQSLYGQLVLGNVLPPGMDEQLAKEAKRAVSAQKQRIAEEVASILKLSVEIDTFDSLEKIVATLRAGAECARLPVSKCVLIAGSKPGVAGAERVGMPCVVLRSSLTSRAEFPSANAVMDGFGGADLTISRLRSLCEKKQSQD